LPIYQVEVFSSSLAREQNDHVRTCEAGALPEAQAGSGVPVRVGGQIKTPDLVHRVEPRYPSIAQNAHVAGAVILEATVDTNGRVQSVHVLRGIPLLNEAAVDAVRQWQYSPLRLNGVPTPFILTVTVTFKLQ
jgi:protein TonB